MKRPLILLLCAAGFVGCSSLAKVSVAPNYRQAVHKIAVLPFDVIGDPDMKTDQVLTDALSTAMIDDGLTVVDRAAVQSEATKQGIDLSKPLDLEALTKLSQPLGVDGFFLGTVQRAYEGPSSGTQPIDIATTTDKHGKLSGVNVSGGGSYANAGGYYTVDMSARLVHAGDFVTLVSAHIPNGNGGEMIDEIKDKMK